MILKKKKKRWQLCNLTTFRIALNKPLALILLYSWGTDHLSWVYVTFTGSLKSHQNFSMF